MKKKRDIKSFYRIDETTKTAFIDIAIDFYREIYNVWDFSPFANRDLDDDLFEYLENCAYELPGKYKMVIVFHIPSKIENTKRQDKSIKGYHNFFEYKIRKLELKKNQANKHMLIYGLLGIFLLLSSIFIRRTFVPMFLVDFLSEGFSIGGWVLFWELFSTLFFTKREFIEEERALRRLMNSEILYEIRN